MLAVGKRLTIGLGMAAAIALMLVGLLHSGLLSVAATSVVPVEAGFVHYTDNPNGIDLPLDSPAQEGEAFAVFEKTEGRYAFLSYSVMEIGTKMTSLVPTAPWEIGTQNLYYVVITALPESEIRFFDGVRSDTTILEKAGRTLELQELAVVFDNFAPVISDVTITNNVVLTELSTIDLVFTVTDDIAVDEHSLSVSINETEAVGISALEDDRYKAVFPASSFTQGLEHGDPFPELVVRIMARDQAGNAAIPFSNTFRAELVYSCLEVEITSIASNNPNNALVKIGDTISVHFETSVSVEVADTDVLIAEKPAAISNPSGDGRDWYATYSLNAGDIIDDNYSIPVTVTVTSAGISASATADAAETVIYYAPIHGQSLRFRSNNRTDSGYAIDGDIVAVSFTTTHPVQVSSGEIAGRAVTFSSVNGTGMEWTGFITVEPDSFAAGTQLYFSLLLTDQAGNPPVTVNGTDTEDTIIYCEPIVISNLSTESNNPEKRLAKNGDTIAISFETPRPVSINNARLAGASFKLISEDDEGMIWTGFYTITGAEPELVNDSPLLLVFTATGEYGYVNVAEEYCSVKYLAPVAVYDLVFFSDNEEPDVAKNGDTVTVTFSTLNLVQISNAVIGGQEVVFSNLDGEGRSWRGSYTITGAEGLANEEPIGFSLTLTDAAGNVRAVSVGDTESSVTYYAPIELGNLTINSSNAKANLAKDGDEITVTITTENRLILITKATIAGQNVSFSGIGNGKTWTGRYTLANGDLEDLETVGFEFTAMDRAFNIISITDNDLPTGAQVIYYAPIQISELAFFSDNANSLLTKDGDTVTLSFFTQHEVEISQGEIAGETVQFSSANDHGTAWSATYTIINGLLADNDDIPFTFGAIDPAGNSISVNQTDATVQIKYYAPLIEAVSRLGFMSDNAKASNYAKDDDIVTVTLESTHPTIISNASIAGRKVTFLSEDGMLWTGSYALVDHLIEDNTDITFSLEINDAAGNTSEQKTDADSTKVRYLQPLQDSFQSLKFFSDNADPGFVKIGDTVTLSFSLSHPVQIRDMTIAGQEVVCSSLNDQGMDWSASLTIDTGTVPEDNSDLSFSFTVDDEASNDTVVKTEKDTKMIRYLAPIVIQDLAMTSDNSNSETLARDGDRIRIDFTTTHPVTLSETLAGGQAVAFNSVDDAGMDWSATYTVRNGDIADNDIVALNFVVNDMAGNTPITVTEASTGQIRYYAPIEISDVIITSDNINDGNKYAKAGDTITVRFTSNHDVNVANVTIAGFPAQQWKSNSSQSAIAKDWTLTYKLKNGDVGDLAPVTFAFSVDDAAGNNRIEKSNADVDVRNLIQYFASLTATTSIKSSGTNLAYAKNGDTIQVYVRTNHPASLVSASIFDREATISAGNGQELVLTYTLPIGETSLEEGVVKFAYGITDLAGNTLSVNGTNDSAASQVIYDRTSPAVAITPDFSGFTNETISYSVTFTDTNIEGLGLSATVNGNQRITASERASISGTTYTKKISLAEDGEYKIVASAIDKAGNRCTQDAVLAVSVDKTDPEITSVQLDFDRPQIFSPGFVISDYFQITEKYINEIICLVTDNDGVQDWDIDTPILAEGKKTINLMVTDMAGNHSNTVTYDLYIDGTAPKVLVHDSVSGTELVAGTNENPFIADMTLTIALEALHIGDEPDYLSTLRLINEDGGLVLDLLEGGNQAQDGMFTITLDSFGEYSLIAEAMDEVGNRTGILEYHFSFQDKSLLQKYYENKPVFYSSAAVFLVLIAGLISVTVIRRRRAGDA